MDFLFAGTTSCVRAVVESDTGAGGWAGGLSGWVSAGAAIAFGTSAALLCRAGRWVHAGCGDSGDGPGGHAGEPEVGSAADSLRLLRGASAGAYTGAALSLWRRDAPS